MNAIHSPGIGSTLDGEHPTLGVRIQVDPDTIYTVFAYNHKTRKIVIAPLGE